MTKASFHLTSLLVRLGLHGVIRRLVLPHGPSPELSEEDVAIMWRDYASVRAMRAGVQEAKQAGSAHALLRELQAAGTPDVPTIALQAGRLVVVEGAGHLIPQEQPAAVHRAIVDVLARVGGRTPPSP